jgi:tripartite-type tricarboxylate transporter receptor subunit TctC
MVGIPGFPRASALVLLSLCTLGQPVSAQTNYPSQNINMLVASAAGGITDVIARLIVHRLTEKLGQTIVIEIRAGSGGNLAARAVSTAAPDGHMILATTTALAINETAYANKGYATEDLRPVGIVAFSPDAMAVHPNHPAKNLSEFLAAAKTKSFTYSTAGVGTAAHIGAEYLFRESAKVTAVHVPYTGGAPAVTAVLGNHVDSLVLALPALTSHLKEGRLRALGLASPSRIKAVPNVPTYAEMGSPNVHSGTWVGFFVPTKTPDAVVLKLNGAINDILKLPEVQERLTAMGFEAMIRNQPETDAYFKNEVATWAKMVRAVGLAGSN